MTPQAIKGEMQHTGGLVIGVDLTMDVIAQVIHECETCAAIKQAKWVKPLWYGGQWLKYNMGRPGRLTISQHNKPAKASAMCFQW